MRNALNKLCLIIDSIDDEKRKEISKFLEKEGVEHLSILTSQDYNKAREKLLIKIKESIIENTELEVEEADLIIKVGKEKSLDGTIILETSYAEIAFVEKGTSEFEISDLEAAIEDFHSRKRNFGA